MHTDREAKRGALDGAAAAMARPVDPDLCRPGQLQTALCNDGVYSCSPNRPGMCSHHAGVRLSL